MGQITNGSNEFSQRITQALWRDLAPEHRRCSEALLRAQLQALRTEAPNADHSFRNCRIAASRSYLRERLSVFRRNVDANRADAATRALGQAVAALQSFYTFSNYVELLAERHDQWQDAVLARDRVWEDAPLHIDEARLLSHYSAIANPQGCDGAPNLDHGSNGTAAGGRVVASWGRTAHEAAVELAQDDMESMLVAAYRQRENYGRSCGEFSLLAYLPSSWIP